MALVHIFAGLLAVTMGAFALSVAKGGRLHRLSGRVFVGAMMVMAVAGGVMAAMQFHLGYQKMNVVAATVTFYLVATALLTVRPRGTNARALDAALTALAFAAASLALYVGVEEVARPKGSWPQAMPLFIFGGVVILAALGDLRLAMGRVLDRRHRIARHLWRMSFGMFIATGSFFLGQAKIFPEPVRIYPLLAVPVIVVLVLMFYWWARVLIAKRLPRTVSGGEALAPQTG